MKGEVQVLYAQSLDLVQLQNDFQNTAVVLKADHERALLEKIIEIDKLKAEIRRLRPGHERDSWSRNPGQGAL